MPFQFVQPILHSAPDTARPLKKVDPGKAKKYLELADILIRRFPSTTSGRSIEFLVDLCRNRNPGPLAPIPFYSTPGQQDLVVIPANPGLARVAPTIRFEAMFQRRPWRVKKYKSPTIYQDWMQNCKAWGMHCIYYKSFFNPGSEMLWSLLVS